MTIASLPQSTYLPALKLAVLGYYAVGLGAKFSRKPLVFGINELVSQIIPESVFDEKFEHFTSTMPSPEATTGEDIIFAIAFQILDLHGHGEPASDDVVSKFMLVTARMLSTVYSLPRDRVYEDILVQLDRFFAMSMEASDSIRLAAEMIERAKTGSTLH